MLRKLIREPSGRKLVRSFKKAKNPYEVWRLLWFNYRPSTAATETEHITGNRGFPPHRPSRE